MEGAWAGQGTFMIVDKKPLNKHMTLFYVNKCLNNVFNVF